MRLLLALNPVPQSAVSSLLQLKQVNAREPFMISRITAIVRTRSIPRHINMIALDNKVQVVPRRGQTTDLASNQYYLPTVLSSVRISVTK